MALRRRAAGALRGSAGRVAIGRRRGECGFSRVRACPPTNYRRGGPGWFDAFGAETVRGESRHQQAERPTSEFTCHREAYIESTSSGITSNVGVEHRGARRCRMLVAPAARGTLDARRDAELGRRDCRIEASDPHVSRLKQLAGESGPWERAQTVSGGKKLGLEAAWRFS